MSRKVARELAFKMIFSYDFQEDDSQLGDLGETLMSETNEITPEDNAYINHVVEGVVAHMDELDQKISQYLKGWTMDRISKTDLAILRLATFEIIYREDIPIKVSVNEAVELAKAFSDETSPSFINGVLAGIIQEMEK